MSADYSAADVTPEERATTRRMVGHLVSMLADEPPQDAGGHPSPEVHQQVGAAWAEWDRQRTAWQVLLAPRLLREAMDDYRGGPHATTRARTIAQLEDDCGSLAAGAHLARGE